MFYNDYEDYMRSVLGYSNTGENTYCSSCNYGINYNDMDYNSNYRDFAKSNVEQMYPDIYKIINPMVCEICDNNTKPVTEYLIEQMTDDVYDNVVSRVEVQNIINLNIGTREADETFITSASENREEAKESRDNRSNSNSSTSLGNMGKNSNVLNSSNKNNLNSSINSKQNDLINVSNRSIESQDRESRSHFHRRNTLLRDLIRILILNRLIRPGRPRPNRPPFRPGFRPEPRPPMPGGPGFGPRPPMPRYNEYEW